MKTALALIDRCLLMAGLAAAVLAGAGPVHIAATEEGKVGQSRWSHLRLTSTAGPMTMVNKRAFEWLLD